MKWNEFYQSIESGDIAPVYLFTGPEAYVKIEALNRLRQALLPSGLEALNDALLEGATARQIIDAAETLPMMCDRRIVTVRDWAPLMPGNSKDEEREVDAMRRWLDDPPKSCALVFYMRASADGRKKLTGILKKKAVVVDFELLTDQELGRWCAGRLKPSGKKIGRAALSLLVFMAGRELTRLSGELEKLAAYLGEERSEITEADVRAVVPGSLEYSVFELMDRLLEGDMLKAQQVVNSLLQGGQSPVGILAMLTRQVRQLTHVRCGLDAGEAVPTIQERLELHPYAAKQTARQCARLSADWLTRLYADCVEFDYAIKSGRLRDQDALNALLFRIGLAADRR